MRITDSVLDHLGGLVARDNAAFGLVIEERYEVLSRLARGGMGEILRARDLRLGREVAMKVVASELSTPLWAARFRSEAETMTRIDHPGVVPIHDLGTLPDGRLYYTMKLIEGRTFDEILRDRRDVRAFVRILVQAASIVQQAHERGIVHRDLKPSNLMVGANEQVYVLDWGIARVLDEARVKGGEGIEPGVGLTSTGLVLGTLEYMPPEQARGELGAIDARSDVFALGAVLYHALVGRPPREGPRTTMLLEKAASPVILAPRKRNAAVPADLEAIVLKALSAAPEGRYASARELGEDLRRWLEGEPVRARTPTPAYRARKFVARRKALSATAAVAVLALGSFATYGYLHREDRALSAAKRREDEVYGPVRKNLEKLPATPAGWKRGLELLGPVLAACPELWEAWMWKGEFHELLREVDPALEAYGRAARLNPRLALAPYGRGRVLMNERGDLEGSLAAFAEALRADPGNEYALLGQARVAVLRGETDEALRICDRAEPRGLHFWDLHNIRALACSSEKAGAKRDLDRAIAHYRKGMEVSPANSLFNNNCALLLEEQGKRDEALVLFTRSIELRPEVASTWSNRGDLQRRRGELEAAKADLDKAVALDPRFAPAYYNRGSLHAARGDFDAAIADTARAAELAPRHVSSRFNLGSLYSRRGDLDRALEHYTKALELDPTLLEAYSNRANVHRKRKDYAAALRDLDRALELQPRSVPAILTRALTLAERGDLREAEREYGRAIEIDPRQAEAHARRGELRIDLNDAAGVVADSEAAMKLDPALWLPYMNRAFVRQSRRDFDGAISDLNEALRRAPDLALGYMNRGLAKRGKGDLAGALEDYDRALLKDPALSQAHYNRGLARAQKGDRAGAIADVQKTLELLPPGSPHRTEIERTLQQLKK